MGAAFSHDRYYVAEVIIAAESRSHGGIPQALSDIDILLSMPHIQPTCIILRPNSAEISSNSTGSDICGIATTNVNVKVDIVRTSHL